MENEAIRTVPKGDRAENLNEMLERYHGVDEYLDHATKEEFDSLVDRLARCGYARLQELQRFNKLPLLERIALKVDEYKDYLIKRSAAIQAMDQAYNSGGRSKVRDAINATYSCLVANFKNFEDLAIKLLIDMIRGKKFNELLIASNQFMSNVVQAIKKDPENIVAIKRILRDLKDPFFKNIKDLFTTDDPMEYSGQAALFNEDGHQRDPSDIRTEFNNNRCTHVIVMIKSLLETVRNRYNDAYTDCVKAGMPHEVAVAEVEKIVGRKIPAELPSEKTLKKQLDSRDYGELCELYNTLKRELS